MNKIVIFALLVLTGCSHAYISRWGDGQVTACCPRHKLACSEEKLDKLADKKCRGSATPLHGEDKTTGMYGYVAGNYGEIGDAKDMCVTYKCN